ncbi:hypothetical protein FDE85_17290 [Clostridium botulinum]|nr:hypothetical protein [Clostridium botulinum]NFR89858.1 hypothetical protein [Clostridium botulinum]NFT97465.1 hypothetical protein [Clostridium botulinum]
MKKRVKKISLYVFLLIIFMQVSSIKIEAFNKNDCYVKCRIDNPYKKVDWKSTKQIKANLHAHSTKSDGKDSIQEVLNDHFKLGYELLSITDHDHLTYPWNDDIKGDTNIIIPKGLNDIAGNEFSSGVHHINGFFLKNLYEFNDEEEVLKQIENQGGLSQLNHPGRYNKEVDWYINLLNKYDSLLGIEVINRDDRYQSDRKLWDNILNNISSDRNVWGFANADSHSLEHIDTAYNVILIDGKYSSKKVKKALKNGEFYFIGKVCTENNKVVNKDVTPPIIDNIIVDNKKLSIEIQGKGIDSIQWIGENGIELATENKFILNNCKDTSYIRAVIKGEGGVAFTQPFRIIHSS